MARTQRVSVALPVAAVEAIRGLVANQKAESVANFVRRAVGAALEEMTDWDTMLAEALRETGGEMTAAERAWADEVLGHRTTAAGTSPTGTSRDAPARKAQREHNA